MAEALGLAASVIAVIDLSAKVASRCSEYYANVKNAPVHIERLQKETRRLKETLERVQSLCDGPNGTKLQASQTLRDEVKDCRIQFARLEKKLEPGKTQKAMSRVGWRALKWPLQSDEVDRIIEKMRRFKDNISFSLQVDQTIQILSIHQEAVLAKLKSVDEATFDSYAEEPNAKCYQGTRVELLRQIDTWASDPGRECIFWLNGMAGTGKSTVSRTVAQNFSDKSELGASFFFKRGEGDRGHTGLLFTSIAVQLVQKLPSLAHHVQTGIEADPAISKKSLKQQFDTLIFQPLGKLRLDPQKVSTIVIVVDALDECDREEDIRVIILLLAQLKDIKPIHVKFFLTSRPELPIRLGFEDISGRYEGLALHQIPEPIVKEDISAFLEHELAMIRDDYNNSVNPNRRLPTDWPGQPIVQSLVLMAVPLFIFATTICRFIKDRKCGQPTDQLTKVLQYKTKSQASKLDATYRPVLDQLLVDITNPERRDIIAEFQQVIGPIITLARPLSANSLDLLLGLPKGTVDSRTDLLHSVFSIPSNPDLPIRLFRLSFRDFLIHSENCETNPFYINEKSVHKILATKCLQRLSTGKYLKKNICNLQTLEIPRAKIDQQTIDKHLPQDIQYACQYWVYHAKEHGSIICDGDDIHNFLKGRFLFWLEALSLIGRISESVSLINNLIAMLDPAASMKASALLYDSNRFILNCLSIADSSPLQLYSAALIFAPTKSVIRNLFQSQVPDWVSQQPKVNSGWNAVRQILEGHKKLVTSVAFSHDSKLLASASEDNTVRIWNAATGLLQHMLESHSGRVYSVAFSHDSKLLASATQNRTVLIWDTATGSLQHTLEGHSNTVYSVAFSYDSKLLASASEDSTVRIWNVAAMSLQQTLKGHGSRVNSVVFSHDSKILASASHDNSVRIWATATGSLQRMLEGDSDSFLSVAISHDSKLLASASMNNAVRIWDVATGLPQQSFEGHSDWVKSMTFSHDSKLLASASEDKTVRIWDTATGSLEQTLEGHSSVVTSVAFSHDSKLLVSGSWDRTARIWDVARLLQQTLEGLSEGVSSATFSQDSKLLASGSFDETVGIWNATTGSLQHTSEGHSNDVLSVAFSQDSKLLASGSSDRTVRIWDATTGSLQHTLGGHSDDTFSVAFSQDLKLLASGSLDNTVQIWDLTTGSLQRTLKGQTKGVLSVTFSHDSNLLASGSLDNTVQIWDLTTGSLQQMLEGHSDGVWSVAFSHNSKLLASGSSDRTVRIWDLATGSLQQMLKGHGDWVWSIAFSHDSKLLASGSSDKIVEIWNLATGSLQQSNTVDRIVEHISFDVTDSNIITNIGRIKVNRNKGLSWSTSLLEAQSRTSYEGLGINESWITYNNQNLLWLPPDFRPGVTNISLSGSTVAIGCVSGRLVLIGISLDALHSYYSE